MKKLLKFLKRVLAIAVMLPLSLLLFPLLVLMATFFFLFDIPIPSTKEEKAKETQLNRAKENADALNGSLCSLEQNNCNTAVMKPVRRKGSKWFVLVAECNGENLKMYK